MSAPARRVASLLLAGVLAGCGAQTGTQPATAGAATTDPTAAATGQVGSVDGDRFGGVPDPNAVEYQPDVDFLPSAPAAIRSVSSDGLTWYLDARAAGVDRIAVGRVLYATSFAVGRVADVRPEGADLLAVTLAPVGLGEVIRNGRIKVDQPLDLAGWSMRSIPDLPGAVGELEPLTVPSDAPPSANARPPVTAHQSQPMFLAPRPPAAGAVAATDILPTMPPPYNQGSTDWAAGDWSGRVAREGGDVLFTVEQHGDLQWNGKVVFHFTTPHLNADLGIVDGEVGDGVIELRGLRQVALGLQAGSYNGLSDNVSQKVEIPVSLDQPVIVGGIAMNLNVTFKFLIQTAFSAKNSTIEALGAYDTEGPLSYDRESGKVDVHWPTINPNPNILDSLKAISVGANGVVFATSIKVMLGLGVASYNAGPYVRLVTSVALTAGSSIGFAGDAMRCRQASVTMQGAFGAGLTMTDTVAAGVNQILKRMGSTAKVESENTSDLLSEPLFSKAFWSPDTDYCKLAS